MDLEQKYYWLLELMEASRDKLLEDIMEKSLEDFLLDFLVELLENHFELLLNEYLEYFIWKIWSISCRTLWRISYGNSGGFFGKNLWMSSWKEFLIVSLKELLGEFLMESLQKILEDSVVESQEELLREEIIVEISERK